MNSAKNIHPKTLCFAGTFLALLGAGLAGGEGVLTSFTNYGYMGLVGALLVFFLFFYVGTELMTTGYRKQFDNVSDIYTYYAGQPIGTCYEYFSILFISILFFLLISTAESLLQEQYGLPKYIGGILMAVCVTLTASIGLNNILKILSKIGAMIIISAILLGLIAIAQNPEGLTTVEEVLLHLDLPKPSNSTWLSATLSHMGFYILLLPIFLTAIGKTANNQQEAKFGAMLGATGFLIASIMVSLGFMANIELVALTLTNGLDPGLQLAKKVHPWLAVIFSIIIILGIYATAVTLLWSLSLRFAHDKTNDFRVLTIGFAIAGTFIALAIPFDNIFKFVAMVHSYNKYLSIIFIFLMLYKTISRKLAKT